MRDSREIPDKSFAALLYQKIKALIEAMTEALDFSFPSNFLKELPQITFKPYGPHHSKRKKTP
ncbi:hypothetical protein GIB67_034717 [Kingdonia uniflora]|uniref:Uncharacterized protein n=1 Tax=Kingdonia uniflora TaxID=39325 RepID=A0A7J7MLC1_9MAGN|nr:hypothetical protein GIB67_034717 [Kingdonia uniflora]